MKIYKETRLKSGTVVGLIIIILGFAAIAVRSTHYPDGKETYCQKNNTDHENCAASDANSVFFWQIEGFFEKHNPLITALSGIAVAGFTGTLWCVTWQMMDIAAEQRTDMERATKAAESSVQTAIKTLAATQRPWVNIKLDSTRIASAITYGDARLTLRIVYSLENTGNTPALFIMPSIKIFPAFGKYNIQGEMMTFSKECRQQVSLVSVDERRHPGVFMFPNQTPEIVNIGTTAIVPDLALAPYGFFINIFCVVQYVSPVDREWHQTCIILDVLRRVDGPLAHTPHFVSGMGDIPQDYLLIRQGYAGAYAD